MRAMLYRSYSGPLEAVDMARPTPGRDQVLIRAHVTSVNPVDWKIAAGKTRPFLSATFPAVPCFDLAGEVVELGAGVTGFAIGDRVNARVGHGTGAAAAEFVVSGVDVTTKLPTSVDYDTGAALPLAGMTALQGLRDRCGLPMRDAEARVLVIGASGGVGHFAVQIAKAAGARVTGVCSGRNAEMVRSLGADDVIDYTQADAWAGKGPWDMVYDCVAGEPSKWMDKVADGGTYASCMPSPAVFFRALINPFSKKRTFPVMLKSSAADLAFLDELVSAGKLRAVIDSRFPLSELPQAWERSQSGRTTGKILVFIDEPSVA